jgi:2-polyprenyl-6-methoxyphenol hydroxylase-like FAD-dependent oxidoreductase
VLGRAGQRDLPAGFVVGADGIGSRVAREVAAPVQRLGVGASAVLYAYFDQVAPDGYEWAYGDGAASGIIPTNDGLSCVFVATSPDRMRLLRRDGDAEQAFAALFEAASPEQADRLAGAARVGRMHGWAGRPAFVRRAWGTGWALVGDAGYYLDPISTHGMTQALRDADLLAGALLEVMSGATSEPVALSRYQNVRDQLTAQLLRATDRIATYAWDIGEVQSLLREASAAMTPEVELLESLPAVGPAVAQTAARS